jgi:hypothetical protein
MGPSAGGHLVALLGTSGGVGALEGDLGGHNGTSSRVSCVVDQFGPSDLLAMGRSEGLDHDSPDSPESRLVGGPIQERKEAARSASPVSYVTPDDPPFLIVHGTADPLVPFDQSKRLYEALHRVGVEALLVPVTGGGHGGFRSPELQRRIGQFFAKHLLGQDVTISQEPIRPGQAGGTAELSFWESLDWAGPIIDIEQRFGDKALFLGSEMLQAAVEMARGRSSEIRVQARSHDGFFGGGPGYPGLFGSWVSVSRPHRASSWRQR